MTNAFLLFRIAKLVRNSHLHLFSLRFLRNLQVRKFHSNDQPDVLIKVEIPLIFFTAKEFSMGSELIIDWRIFNWTKSQRSSLLQRKQLLRNYITNANGAKQKQIRILTLNIEWIWYTARCFRVVESIIHVRCQEKISNWIWGNTKMIFCRMCFSSRCLTVFSVLPPRMMNWSFATVGSLAY